MLAGVHSRTPEPFVDLGARSLEDGVPKPNNAASCDAEPQAEHPYSRRLCKYLEHMHIVVQIALLDRSLILTRACQVRVGDHPV